MANIRRSSELRDKFNEVAAFEQRETKLELAQKLLEAEGEVRAGEPLVAHEEVWARLRELCLTTPDPR